MKKPTFIKIQVLLSAITSVLLFSSLYFQYILGLQPCPLCLMQRLCVFILLGLMGLSFVTLRKAHIVSLLQMLIACAGLFFSIRQLWLQSLPAGKIPACMPGFDVMIKYFPWQKIVHALFWGTGDCAEVTWSLLGISMPGWTALYFLFVVVLCFILFLRTRTIKL